MRARSPRLNTSSESQTLMGGSEEEGLVSLGLGTAVGGRSNSDSISGTNMEVLLEGGTAPLYDSSSVPGVSRSARSGSCPFLVTIVPRGGRRVRTGSPEMPAEKYVG